MAEQNGRKRDRPERSRRQWKVRARQDPVTGDISVNRDDVRNLLMDIESLGHLAGGSFVLAPVRVRLDDGEHEVWGWIATWETAPALNPDQAERLLFGDPVPPAAATPPPPEPVEAEPVADLDEARVEDEELDVLPTG